MIIVVGCRNVCIMVILFFFRFRSSSFRKDISVVKKKEKERLSKAVFAQLRRDWCYFGVAFTSEWEAIQGSGSMPRHRFGNILKVVVVALTDVREHGTKMGISFSKTCARLHTIWGAWRGIGLWWWVLRGNILLSWILWEFLSVQLNSDFRHNGYDWFPCK